MNLTVEDTEKLRKNFVEKLREPMRSDFRRVVDTIDDLRTQLSEARGTIAAVRAEVEGEGCQDVQRKPAEYVTREMAIDAGDPTMAGTMLRGEVVEPCGVCAVCRILALLPDKEGE